MSDLPPLPKGFVLDDPQADTPQLPEGFALDPAQQPATFGSKMMSAVTDIPSEIYNAGADALGSIGENLNPFSDKRRAAIEARSKMPLFSPEAFKSELGQIGDVGSGLSSILAVPAAPVTGTARSVIGHTMEAITPGTDYEQGKKDADLAMMGLRAGSVGKHMQPVTKPAPAPSAQEISAAADAGFDAARNSGVAVPAQQVQNLAQTIRRDLGADGFRDYLAPKTYAVLDELENPAAGASANVADLHGIRRVLGKAAASPDGTERAAATRVMGELDKLLTQVSPELKDAIGNYASLKKADELTGRAENAQNNAGAANSGRNTENALRQQLRAVLNSPKLRRGYKPEQLEQMRKIVRGTMTADAVRAAGNFLGGGLGMHGAISAGAGYAAAGPAGLLAPVAGAGMKMLGNRMAASKVAKLHEMIRAQSPLAQSMPPIPVPTPSPLLSAVFPYGLQQSLPLFMGAVPARADDKQRY